MAQQFIIDTESTYVDHRDQDDVCANEFTFLADDIEQALTIAESKADDAVRLEFATFARETRVMKLNETVYDPPRCIRDLRVEFVMNAKTDDERQAKLRAVLHSDQAFDYDYLNDILSEPSDDESHPYDLFVRIAYVLSTMKLTPDEAREAARQIASLAVDTLLFNMREGSEQTDANIEAADIKIAA